jgi:hypothetical protein
MADLAAFVAQARSALERPSPLACAEDRVPGRPGLYAIYGDATTWEELGLGQPSDDRALYVGKAEDSLASRPTLGTDAPASRQYDARSPRYSTTRSD